MELGVRLKELREQRGLSLQELAKRAALSRPFLYQIEAGRAAPSIRSIERLAEALGIQVSALFDSGVAAAGDAADGASGLREAAPAPGHHGAPMAATIGPPYGPTVHQLEPIRRNHRKLIIWPDDNERGYLLSPDLLGQLQVTLAEHEPGAPMMEAHAHDGVVFLYCLEGSYEVWIDGERHLIREGDALTFPATLAHTYRYLGNTKGRALWIELPSG